MQIYPAAGTVCTLVGTLVGLVQMHGYVWFHRTVTLSGLHWGMVWKKK